MLKFIFDEITVMLLVCGVAGYILSALLKRRGGD
jgi:hypothetical protein